MEKPRTYGLTGEIGKDGLLNPEQSHILNRLQEKAAVACMDYLDKMGDGQEHPLVAMATGIGKGNIIHRLIEKQIRRKQGSKVLVIAGTKLILVRQTHKALADYQQTNINADNNGFDYIDSEETDDLIKETTSIDREENPLKDEASFLYKTGKIREKDVNVHIATIQTVQSETQRGNLNPEDYDLVIVDEVHNIGTEKRRSAVGKFKRVIGFTATPVRFSGHIKTPEQYGFKIIESLPLPEAQELRLLPPLIGIQIDTKSVVGEIPTTPTGLIDYKKLEKLLKNNPNLRPYIADRLVNIISEGERNYKTVIAVNFVWEAQELAELLFKKGVKVGIAINQKAAKALDSKEIPALNSIERYKLPENNEKSIQVLISPYVASEGFDAPATEILVWASPTDSYLRYTQYTGRLARRHPGKRFGLIVDCLYQTSQYNWSYNMGMWMKGHIRELDNGLLYLGPETDIENLKRLPQVEGFMRKSATKSLEDLQKQGLLEVQDSEIPITLDSLQKTFIGAYQKTISQANKILEELSKSNPDAVILRIKLEGYTHVVRVVDKKTFTRMMEAKGIKARPDSLTEIGEDDFVVSEPELLREFIGSSKKLKHTASQVVDEIMRENPKAISLKKRGTQWVQTISNRQIFLEKMKEKGILTKLEMPRNIDEEEFSITIRNLTSMFKGSPKKLTTFVTGIQEKTKDDPSFFQKRRSGPKTITVVKNKDRFIELMIAEGAILHPLEESRVEPISTEDFSISHKKLGIFKGRRRSLMNLANQVADELSQERDGLVAKRKSKGYLVTVVTDRERFIQEMVKRGAKLKPPK